MSGFLIREGHNVKSTKSTQKYPKRKEIQHIMFKNEKSNIKKFFAKYHEKIMRYSWHEETPKMGQKIIKNNLKEKAIRHSFSFFLILRLSEKYKNVWPEFHHKIFNISYNWEKHGQNRPQNTPNCVQNTLKWVLAEWDILWKHFLDSIKRN